MFCINCSKAATRVINSRTSKKTPLVWRRRLCLGCDHRFTTHEIPSTESIVVSSRHPSNPPVPFSPGRLLLSIAQAFAHDPERGKQASWDLTQTVIMKLFLDTHRQLTTEDIATVTHQVLDRFDPAAGAQYALTHHLLTSVRRRGRPSFGAGAASRAHEKPQ